MSIQKLKLRISLFYMKHLLLDFELFTDKQISAMVQQKLSGPPEPVPIHRGGWDVPFGYQGMHVHFMGPSKSNIELLCFLFFLL